MRYFLKNLFCLAQITALVIPSLLIPFEANAVGSPGAPEYIGGADVGGSANSGTENLAIRFALVEGNYLYVASTGSTGTCSGSAGSAVGCELKIFDISDPTTPTYVAGGDASGLTNSGASSTHFIGLGISGDYLYVASSGSNVECSQTAGSAIGCELQVWDISTPSSPSYVGGGDTSGTTNSGTGSGSFGKIQFYGSYAVISRASGQGGPSGCSQTPGSAVECELQVWDISTPSAPAYVGGGDISGSTNSGTGASIYNNSVINGDYLYIGQLGNATECSQTAGSAVGCELQVWDLSTPSAPAYVGGGDGSGATNSGTASIQRFHDIEISGNYAYIATRNNGTDCSSALGCELQVWDISTPSAPAYVGGGDASGTTNSGTANYKENSSIQILDGYVYLAGTANTTECSQTVGSALGCEIQVWDISTPSAPAYVGGGDTAGSTNSGTTSKYIYNFTISGYHGYFVTTGDATACSQTPGSAIGCEIQVWELDTAPVLPVRTLRLFEGLNIQLVGGKLILYQTE